MSRHNETTEYLFSYGTLQSDSVQLSTFGRKLEGQPDALPGCKLIVITIDDEEFVKTSGPRTTAVCNSRAILPISWKAQS